MTARDLCQLAGRLLRHPAAPYYEHAVREEVEAICAENCLDFQRDVFGNVLVRLRAARTQRPLVLAAHLDHPGFEMIRPLSRGRWLARFRGGVPERYFRRGLALRLMPGAVPARITRRVAGDKVFQVQPAYPVAVPPQFAVWELEDFKVRQGRIYARACDDLIGVACVLAALIELKQRRAKANVIGLISRAEEIGFHGALAATTTRALPKNSLVISLETSRELPGVTMGQGVILRVGDRTSIFDSDAMRFLAEVAAGLKARRKGFQFQRGLMSGGTCEATAFQEFGYQTAAVCVALGNYHNCARRNRIAAEYVSIKDACGMVDLLAAAARQMSQYARFVGKLPKRLNQMRRKAQPRLRQTAADPRRK
jgi:putative aminopeptidase FrvX